MRLNNDCIRDVLMLLEDKCMPSSYVRISDVHKELGVIYGTDIITGHILLLEEAGFIKVESRFMDGDGLIDSITWTGQQYIKDIRNNDVWGILKEQVGDFSLDIIVSLAKDVALNIAKKKLKDYGVMG